MMVRDAFCRDYSVIVGLEGYGVLAHSPVPIYATSRTSVPVCMHQSWDMPLRPNTTVARRAEFRGSRVSSISNLGRSARRREINTSHVITRSLWGL